jgi:Holliday junction resolvase RusA-like endonuclease
MRVSFIIPGEPCGKGRPRFTAGGRAYTPAKTANYETLVKWAFQAVENKTVWHDAPLRLTVDAYFKQPQSASRLKHEAMNRGNIRPTKKPDADNILKIIADALNGLAYHDDAQIVETVVRKWYAPLWAQPQVEVTIEEVENAE